MLIINFIFFVKISLIQVIFDKYNQIALSLFWLIFVLI